MEQNGTSWNKMEQMELYMYMYLYLYLYLCVCMYMCERKKMRFASPTPTHTFFRKKIKQENQESLLVKKKFLRYKQSTSSTTFLLAYSSCLSLLAVFEYGKPFLNRTCPPFAETET